MKKLILILLCQISAFSCFAQNEPDLGRYYKFIYFAERNIIDSNYLEAEFDYIRAFSYNPTPFAIDCTTICSLA